MGPVYRDSIEQGTLKQEETNISKHIDTYELKS